MVGLTSVGVGRLLLPPGEVLETAKLTGLVIGLVIEWVCRSIILCCYRLCPRMLDKSYEKYGAIRTMFSKHLEGPKPAEDNLFGTTTSELLRKNGLDADEHIVETEDGFSLVLHRITSASRPARKCTEDKRPPILFVHGMMMNTESFVCVKHVSLPIHLFELGYDVWLGNNRGNKYSWMHRQYKRCDKRYWDYSMDELARYDVPTLVNYVLSVSKIEKLIYIGFSNGSSQMLAALSSNDSLNNKVHLFIALAPACKITGLRSSTGPNDGGGTSSKSSAALLYPIITASSSLFFTMFGRRAMMTVCDTWRKILSPQVFTSFIDLCLLVLFNWRLYDVSDEDKTIFYSHLFSSMSTKCVHHWFQMLRCGKFQYYDEGRSCTGDISVPQYHLLKIQTPVVLLHGDEDKISDIEWVESQLVNCTSHCVPRYAHLDFLTSNNVPQQVFPLVRNAIESSLTNDGERNGTALTTVK